MKKRPTEKKETVKRVEVKEITALKKIKSAADVAIINWAGKDITAVSKQLELIEKKVAFVKKKIMDELYYRLTHDDLNGLIKKEEKLVHPVNKAKEEMNVKRKK